ncbi:Uncharacterised protein [Helicobacter mustelae]|nr:Uncharacterised protein [Helicobacter mustelae]
MDKGEGATLPFKPLPLVKEKETSQVIKKQLAWVIRGKRFLRKRERRTPAGDKKKRKTPRVIEEKNPRKGLEKKGGV